MTNEQKTITENATQALADIDDVPKATKKPKAAENKEEVESDRGSRSHTVLTYIDHKYLNAFLNNATWILHWAYCHHDKDVWSIDDEKVNPNHKANTPKTPHTHIVLYTKDYKTYTAICKQFDKYSISIYGKENKQNTRSEYCDLNIQYRYLLHKDDPQKYQYSSMCLVQDYPIFWEKYNKGIIDSPNSAYKIVEELLNCTPYRTLAMKYGRDFIIHAKQYEDCARKIRIEDCVANSPISDDLIKVVLDCSPFYDGQIDDFFKIINYLREVFNNEYNNPHGFEKYLKGLGLND